MVVAHFTRSKATPRLRRGSRRVSLSPPFLALPLRSRKSTRECSSAARANVEISLAISRVPEDDAVSDPPSPAGRRSALPFPCRGRSRTDLSEVRRRLMDHLAALFPDTDPPIAPPEVFANDIGPPPPLLQGSKPVIIPETSPSTALVMVQMATPPNHDLPSPPSPGFSVMSDQSRLTPEGRRSWAHYDQTSRFMNRLPPYF